MHLFFLYDILIVVETYVFKEICKGDIHETAMYAIIFDHNDFCRV